MSQVLDYVLMFRRACVGYFIDKLMIEEEKKKEIRNKLSFPTRTVSYDLEMTGFNPYQDKIIEFGACYKDVEGEDKEGSKEGKDKGNIKSFSRLVKLDEGIKLPEVIVNLTGITDELLEKEGIPLCQALKEFETFVGHNALLISHGNDSSDQLFLEQAYDRCMYLHEDDLSHEDQSFIMPRKWVFLDTYRLSQQIRDPSKKHSLAEMAKEYNVINPSVHRALGDAQTLLQIWDIIVQQKKEEKRNQLKRNVGEGLYEHRRREMEELSNRRLTYEIYYNLYKTRRSSPFL